MNTLLLHAVKPNCLLQHEYEEQNYFISPCALPVDTCNDQCTDSRTGTFDTRSGRGSFRALIALMDSLMGLPKTDIHSVMILRHGKVIAEIYPELSPGISAYRIFLLQDLRWCRCRPCYF